MTHRYRSRPVEIEAARFTAEDDNGDRIEAWIRENGGECAYFVHAELSEDHDATPRDSTGDTRIEIHTLEGVMSASVGDYIIRGTAGEFYPCKPEIFAAKYERVD